MKQEKENRLIYIDILKIIAISAVIMIHISAKLFYSWGSVNVGWWWIGNIADSISRFGVPIFLMISGSLLLSKDKLEENTVDFFAKRFKRVFIPLVAWSLIYFFWKERFSLELININIIKENIKVILQGGIYYHLNFLYYLSGLYLIAPVLKVFLKSAKQKDLNYLLALWFLGDAIYPVITRFFNIQIGVPIYLATSFVGYYILGYYIRNYHIEKTQKKIVYGLGLLSLLVIPLGTYFLTVVANSPDEWFYSYLNFAVILVSISVMVFIEGISWEKILKNKNFIISAIRTISEASFGIYLFHPIIMEILALWDIDSMYIHPLIGIPVSFILIFIFSFFVIFIIQKSSFLKRIV